jgi:streptogramin lyase
MLVLCASGALIAGTASAGVPSPGDPWFYAGGWSLPPHPSGPTDNGDAYYRYHVATDSSGSIYVSDQYANAVHKYDGSGHLLQTWSAGTSMFWEPLGMACDAAGNLYVGDRGNFRILRLSPSGVWSVFYSLKSAYAAPLALAADSAGNVFATVWYTGMGLYYVYKFSPTGTLLVSHGGQSGTDPGAFGNRPLGIACSSSGHVLVADTGNSRIQEFDGNLAFVRSWSGSLNQPEGLTTGLEDEVVVCDPANYRLIEYNREGMSMTSYGGTGFRPDDTVYGPIGNLWVVESQNMRLVHLQNDVTAPVTTAICQPAAWTVAYVTVTLAAKDDLSGVKSTEYRIGSGAWTTYTAPFVVDRVGRTAVGFRSTDAMNHVEAEKMVAVGIDRTGPTTKALADVTVRRGKKATFRFKVSDLAPQVDVVIRIFKGTALRKSVKVGSRATGRVQSYKWKCTLARGSYTWKVCATDLAGNLQRLAGKKWLTVTW